MILFEIFDSDFWGYCPVLKEYELREEIVTEFENMLIACIADPERKLFGSVRKVGGVPVTYYMELSEHFRACQFTFKVRSNPETEGTFVGYCMYAVWSMFKAISTATVDVDDKFMSVVVSLPLAAVTEILIYIDSMTSGRVREVSTRVYTSVSFPD